MKSTLNECRALGACAGRIGHDENGAGRSIELIAAVAVGVLILAALFRMAAGQGGFISGTETNLAKLIKGEPLAAGKMPDGNPGAAPGGSSNASSGGTPSGSGRGSGNRGGNGSGSASPSPSAPGTSSPGSGGTSSTPGGTQPGTTPTSPRNPNASKSPADKDNGFWGELVQRAIDEIVNSIAKTHVENLFKRATTIEERLAALIREGHLDRVSAFVRSLSGVNGLLETERKSKELIRQGRFKEAWENDCDGLARFLVDSVLDLGGKVPGLKKTVVGRIIAGTGISEAAGYVGRRAGDALYDPLNHGANWLARQPWWPKNRGPRNPIYTTQAASAATSSATGPARNAKPIVSSVEPRAVYARAVLNEAGVNLDDPANQTAVKVAAPAATKTAASDSKPSNRYYDALNQRLRSVRGQGATEVRRMLGQIADEVQAGAFPR